MSRGDAERDATLRAHGLGAHARLEKESAAKLRAAAQLVVKTWGKAADERRPCDYCAEPATHMAEGNGGRFFGCAECAENESVTPATWQPLSTIMADAIAALGEALRSE